MLSLFLPFLPMLPTQILLNNFLYDLAQITHSHRYRRSRVSSPTAHWDISLIRNFMVLIGPIQLDFRFLDLLVLVHFSCSQAEFHTGWFFASLVTQALVLLSSEPLETRERANPSGPLTATVLLIVLVGILIPFSPTAKCWDHGVASSVLFLSYRGYWRLLATVEVAKRRLFRGITMG